MYRDTGYLLPTLLALAHFTSAIPAPLAPRATGGTNPILPRATGGTNPILPRATGNLPVDAPESSPIQISYALAPTAAPIVPQPVEPVPILEPILSEAVDQDEFYRRQIENETDSSFPLPPPDNETTPDFETELVSLGILPFEKRAPAPTPPATAYLQPDATTITVASFQTPPAEAPSAPAESVDLASYLGQLASLGFFPPIAKRAPAPTAPASDYAPTEVVTVSDVPFQTPVPAAPPAQSLIPALQSLGLLLPYAKREALPILPPDSYLNPDVTTVFDTPTPPPAAATPLPTESIIPYLQSLGLLLPYAKREAVPTPPPASYTPTDITPISEAPLPTPISEAPFPTPISEDPFPTPISATPTQPLASIVLESYIPELVSLGVFPVSLPDASPTPSNAYNKRQDDPNGADGDWLIPLFPTQVLQSWEGLGPAVTPAATVVGVSEASEPTILGVSAAWRA